MNELSQLQTQLESLAASLADCALQQHEALLKGDFDSLTAITCQRQERFERLMALLADTQTRGYPIGVENPADQEGELGQTARKILELDHDTLLLLEKAAKKGGAEMEGIRRGRLALNYKSQSAPKKMSKVDLVR